MTPSDEREMPIDIWARVHQQGPHCKGGYWSTSQYETDSEGKPHMKGNKPKRVRYMRADMITTPPPCSCNSRATPSPVGDVACRRCNDTGTWVGGADKGTEYKCDPCPAPMPEYTDKGYMVVDRHTVICETHGNSCTKEKQPDGSIMAYCSQCKGGDVGEALEKLVDLIVYHMDTEQTLGRAAMRSEGFPVGVLLPRESLKKNLLSDKEYGPVIETIRAALTGQAGEKG